MRPNRNFVQIYSYTEFEWLDIVEIEFQPGQERGTLGKVSIYHSQNHEVIILSNGKPLAMPLDFRACYTVKHSCSLLQDLSKLEQTAADRKVSEILKPACKDSTVRWPGPSGFCYRACEFCSKLAQWASEVFLGIQITEEL